jgi:hypothetical protein
MLAVEREQVFYAAECSRSNVQRIGGGLLWHQMSLQNAGGKRLRIRANINEIQPFE